MPLNNQEAKKIGLRVQRIEGTGEQEIDIGRIGIIASYNMAMGSIGITYDKTETLPSKTDDICTYFEFEKVETKTEV